MSPQPWKCSLHGGHSKDYCEHAYSTLRDMVEAAIAAGYDTFGITEHCARTEDKYVFVGEQRKGITVQQLVDAFDAYAADSLEIVQEYSDRIHLLRGFELEIMPPDRYPEMTAHWRKQHGFDYVVGSVHWVYEQCVDEDEEYFKKMIDQAGSLEALCCEYYRLLADMVKKVKPEVVGHFDLVRLFGQKFGDVDTPQVIRYAEQAMQTVAEAGSILDLNTAGIRKGVGHPYPAPHYVEMAKKMGIPFCFGDDSHSVGQVGFGLAEAREYLLKHGITSITTLVKHGDELVKELRSL
ncbi:MAG: histidinol-phosphatase [Armatimonadota bacterium]